MAVHKSLETISGMILNWSQPKFAARSVADEKQGLKAINHLEDLPQISRSESSLFFI